MRVMSVEITDIYKSKFDVFDENQLELIIEEYYQKYGYPDISIIKCNWDDCCEILSNELKIGIA